MVETLLQTKLTIPRLRASFVRRPRLVKRLNDGLESRLILLSAPAGYGKTTLVTEWLADLKPLTAWISLDGEDNDPRRFLDYLIAAVRQVRAGFAESMQSMLRSPQPAPDEILLTVLLNELTSIPSPFIMVLDDYHVIHSLSIHKQLAFLLEHQSSNMHLVLMTRADPLLPLARLRAGGQLIEIRQEELRFTLEETADFLGQVMGLALSPDEVGALERRTEGWIAGSQMAALSMQGHPDPRAFIQSFTGSNRYILDYLIEEVFERQAPGVKDFLLKTSILKNLSARLCEEVTEQDDSQAILERLEQENLFILPLDQTRTWYRYHQLFSEMLRLRLHAASALDEKVLHRRASQWFEIQGFLHEAVEHSIQAEDWGGAARLLGAASEGMLKQGEYVTLLTWCGRIPPAVVLSSGELCMVHAWAALMASQFDVAEPLLDHAQQMADPGSNFLGQVASAQAFLARAKRDNAQTIEKSEQALALLPEAEILSRSIIAMNLGLAYWHEGRLTEAEPALQLASDLGGRSGNFIARLTAQIFLARIPAVQGKLHQAAAMADELIRAGGQIPHLCQSYFDLAAIHHEWNDLAKAGEYFEQGLKLSQRSGNVELIQAGVLLRAILAHAQGDEAGAIAALNEADGMARDFPAAIRSRTAAFGVRLALARNDVDMLAHWSARVEAEVDAHSFYRFMGLTRPRLLISQGKKEEASTALQAIHETAKLSGWGYGMIVVRILQSLAAGTTAQAVQSMSEALRLGEPENFLRSFMDEGPAVIPILQEVARSGVEAEYAGRILSAMGAGSADRIHGQPGLEEPLSEREVEVLRLVTAGLSNREIAARLFISPGTAKTHIHNLCGKLGVRNRTEAAIWAKEQGLA